MFISTANTVDEMCLDGRARSAVEFVTSAWVVRFCGIVRFLETKPKCFVNEEVVDSVGGLSVFGIPFKIFSVQFVIQTVDWRSEDREGNKLVSEGIKMGPDRILGSQWRWSNWKSSRSCWTWTKVSLNVV